MTPADQGIAAARAEIILTAANENIKHDMGSKLGDAADILSDVFETLFENGLRKEARQVQDILNVLACLGEEWWSPDQHNSMPNLDNLVIEQPPKWLLKE